MLTRRLGFEYARSFQLVSEKAKADVIKSLLLRFAGSIATGEPEQAFLSQEARVEREREQYTSQYQRSLETLTKWGDAYAALLVSVTLIIVISMISTMLYDAGQVFILMLTGTMFIMSFFGAYIICKSAPNEVMTYKNRDGPRERRISTFLLMTLGPVGVLGAVFFGATSGLGVALLILGLSMMPAGIYAYLDNMKVSTLDMEVDKFLRSLGAVAESLGTTLTSAMTRIDRRSLRALEPYIRRLQARLRSRITPKICWDRFVDETGSELVHRSTAMFVDGTGLGGSPEKVGAIASDYALNISLLRSQRHVRALPFAYLTIPLHGAMTALLVFILEIMISFNERLTVAGADLLGSSSGGSSVSVPDLPILRPRT